MTEGLYAPADFFMLRAPALPAEVFLRLSETAEDREACYRLLRELAEQPHCALALAVASPSLWQTIQRLPQAKPAAAKRAYAGLLRYLIRMSTRPTPFGLFSGVTTGTFADETRLTLASPPVQRFRTRPDMDWLLALLQQAEGAKEVVTQLKVRANQTAYLAGGRLRLPYADTYGQRDNRSISLRATSVVLKALELAVQPIPYTELQAALLRAFPQAKPSQVERLLWQLWEHHFLISDLHPPLTDARPAAYLARQLAALKGVETLHDGLQAVLQQTSEFDAAGNAASIEQLRQVEARQASLVPEAQEKARVQLDAALRLHETTLHQQIGVAAARAAELLLRLTPFYEGLPHLKEYRLFFLETYGEGVEVPLLDLLHPEQGLDAPPGYDQPRRSYPLPPGPNAPDTRKWDEQLQALVAETINRQSVELELTEALLKRLERWSPVAEQAPLSLEIYLQVHAASREALDNGEWCVVLGPNWGSPNAGRTFGRFFDLLDEEGMRHLQQLTEREEALQPDVIFAELSYQPREARMANVALRPPLRRYEIAVGTTPSVPPERVISLNDLVVGVRNGRFYLRSQRLGKQVIVSQYHMLNPRLAPNVCRFLSELSMDGVPCLSAFDWGRLSGSPFLPRVTFRMGPHARLVLSPAQWQLRADTVQPEGTGSEEERWFAGLQRWRERWRVPRYVYLAEFDNRLLLDLEHPVMVTELRDELGKLQQDRTLTLQELLPDFEHLWLRDEQSAPYFSELVVPLLRVAQPAVQAAPLTPRRAISRVERSFFPGDRWTYIKLYAAPGQHDELIAGPLRALIRMLQEQRLLDCWFFIRYIDPLPHLRVRCRARGEQAIEPLLLAMLRHSRHLVDAGVIQSYALDPYEREVERYGGPEAIELLEQVFCLDSAVVSNLIAAQQAQRLTLDPLEIAVFSLHQFFTNWGYDIDQCLQWLRKRTQTYAFSAEYRPHRRECCELLAPWEPRPPANVVEQRALLLTLTHGPSAEGADRGSIAQELRKLGDQVRELASRGGLWVSEETLLESLAHMHKIRLLDLDRERERRLYAFWRHTLESIKRRPTKR
ncbi:lantibiotic dehydratase [Thermosporothrix hazakensis]|nr:lantibiotic dehydratase [Thermosporothrix hazakensis]GCE45290.1 lantibiotic dehydratase [Thermosporothrix hazakensis]